MKGDFGYLIERLAKKSIHLNKLFIETLLNFGTRSHKTSVRVCVAKRKTYQDII